MTISKMYGTAVYFFLFSSFRPKLLKVDDLIGTQFRLGKPYRRGVRNHSSAMDLIKPIDTGNYTFLHSIWLFTFQPSVKPLLSQLLRFKSVLEPCSKTIPVFRYG